MKISLLNQLVWWAITDALFHDRSSDGPQLFLILYRYVLALIELMLSFTAIDFRYLN